MIPSADLVLCFASYCILLLLFMAVGTALDRQFLKVPVRRPLFISALRLFLGSVATVAVFSIVFAEGKTVSWLYLLIFIALKQLMPGKSFASGHEARLSRKELFYYLSGMVLAYALVAIDFLSVRPLVIAHVDPDLLSYGKVVVGNLSAGVESSLADQAFREDNYLTPYHFYDLWLAELTRMVTGLNVYLIFSLVITPCLGAILYSSIAASAEALGVSAGRLLPVLAFFVVPDAWVSSAMLPEFAERLSYSIYPYIKWMTAGAAIILSILCAYYLDYRSSIFILLILSVQYVLTLPGIAGGALVTCGLAVILSRDPLRIRALSWLLAFLVLYAFYLVGTKSPKIGSIDAFSALDLAPHVFARLAKIGIVLLLCCFPMLVFLLTNWREQYVRGGVLLWATIGVGATFGTLLISHVSDSLQVQTILSSGLIGALIVMQAIYAIRNGGRLILVACIVLASYGPIAWLVRSFAPTRTADLVYLNAAKAALESNQRADGKIPVAVLKSNDYHASVYDAIGAFRFPGEELNVYVPGMFVFSLSEMDALEVDVVAKERNRARRNYYEEKIRSGVFYRYADDLRSAYSIWEVQLGFMEEFGIHYLIADSNSEINASLKSYLRLIACNRFSEECLYEVNFRK